MSELGLLVESLARNNDQVIPRFDPGRGVFWHLMAPKPRPCFTPEVLEGLLLSLRMIERSCRREMERGRACPIQYTVLASRDPEVFNLGGDISLFLRLIRERDREGLRRYARSCVDAVYGNFTGMDLPITTISLVQGDALGGGFEAALSSGVLVAEKRARFGFPEVLFNLFPGMGAYSLLTRRVDPAAAERIIMGGNLYTASEMHEMGVVDLLARDGEGEAAVAEYMERHSRRRNAYRAMFRVRNRLRPLTRGELYEVAEIWVDTALSVGEKDLRVMERLMRAQSRTFRGEGAGEVVA